jgi:DnaJ family protein A protein 5
MMGKFRGSVDFSDSPNGFFGFVRDTFEQLAKEEKHAAYYEDLDVPDYPTFGHKEDKHEDVVREFYAAWNGFATVKSFAWVDQYRLSDAPDRRVRRAMEKENQKFRDDGKREFNDAVRTLVAFVRKRDPRYTHSVMQERLRL